MVWTEISALIVVPIIRSVGGWLENSFKDGKIDDFEWKQLGETVLRVGLLGAATYYGLSGFGVDITAWTAGFAAFFVDKIFSYIKTAKKA